MHTRPCTRTKRGPNISNDAGNPFCATSVGYTPESNVQIRTCCCDVGILAYMCRDVLTSVSACVCVSKWGECRRECKVSLPILGALSDATTKALHSSSCAMPCLSAACECNQMVQANSDENHAHIYSVIITRVHGAICTATDKEHRPTAKQAHKTHGHIETERHTHSTQYENTKGRHTRGRSRHSSAQAHRGIHPMRKRSSGLYV